MQKNESGKYPINIEKKGQAGFMAPTAMVRRTLHGYSEVSP
jgi:hypothetical protein